MIAGVLAAAIIGVVGYLVYRSKNRRKAGLVVGIALAWSLGLGFAFAQLVPGLPQKLSLPIGLEGQSVPRTMTLEDAQRRVPFPILVPTYLPLRADRQGSSVTDFQLESVRLEQGVPGGDATVVLTYFADRSSSEMQIRERAASDLVGLGEANLKIGEYNAKVTTDGNRTMVVWGTGETWVEMSAEYGKIEIIKTARSMM